MKNTKWRREGGSRTAPTVSIAALLAAVILSGCTAIRADGRRASEILVKHGNEAQRRCGQHLLTVIDKNEAVAAEESKGLLSIAAKKVIIGTHVRENREKFMAECGPVALEIIAMVGD